MSFDLRSSSVLAVRGLPAEELRRIPEIHGFVKRLVEVDTEVRLAPEADRQLLVVQVVGSDYSAVFRHEGRGSSVLEGDPQTVPVDVEFEQEVAT